MRRKKERSKQGQTNKQGKATQHTKAVTFPRKNELPQVELEHTKAVTFPRKNELPQVGLEPTTLYTLDRALYQLSYRGSSAGRAQISHLIVHLMNRLTINSVCACTCKLSRVTESWSLKPEPCTHAHVYLLNPLVCVDCHLCSQWLSQNQHISLHSLVRPNTYTTNNKHVYNVCTCMYMHM